MADSQTLKRRKKSRNFPVESAVEVSTLAINQHKSQDREPSKKLGRNRKAEVLRK